MSPQEYQDRVRKKKKSTPVSVEADPPHSTKNPLSVTDTVLNSLEMKGIIGDSSGGDFHKRVASVQKKKNAIGNRQKRFSMPHLWRTRD